MIATKNARRSVRLGFLLPACVVFISACAASDQKPQQSPSEELLVASLSNDPAGVRLALEHGANVNERSSDGNTALINSCHFYGLQLQAYATLQTKQEEVDDLRKKHREVVKDLISASANPNAIDQTGMTSLMYAAESGDEEVVLLLIGAGADLAKKDNSGATAATHALSHDHEKLGRDLESLAVEQPSPSPTASESEFKQNVRRIWSRGSGGK